MCGHRATILLLSCLAASAPLGGSAARAAFITDGSLSVNVDSNGRFNQIVLNSTAIDLTATFQSYFVNGVAGLIDGSPVVIDGASAAYTARTTAGLDVSVTTRILGPLASNPTTTNVLEQVLVFTNGTSTPQPLGLLSFFDADLKGSPGGDTVAFDSTRLSVFATDAPLLVAAIATAGGAGATLGWDVGDFGTISTQFPTSNRVGPAGPGDTAASIGYNLLPLEPGRSATVSFRYLFSTDLDSVPADFTFSTPEPSSLVLVGSGLAIALASAHRKGGTIRPRGRWPVRRRR